MRAPGGYPSRDAIPLRFAHLHCTTPAPLNGAVRGTQCGASVGDDVASCRVANVHRKGLTP